MITARQYDRILAGAIILALLFAFTKSAAQFNPADSIPIAWPANDQRPGVGDSADVWLYGLAGDTLTGFPGQWVLYVSIPITCPYARYDYPHLQALHNQGLQVVGVQVWEPHPDTLRPEWQSWVSVYTSQAGGPTAWVMPQNVNDSVMYSQPLTFAERVAHTQDIVARYGLTFPVYVDGTDNGYFHGMSDGMPNRAVLVDPDGLICDVTPWYEAELWDEHIWDCMGITSRPGPLPEPWQTTGHWGPFEVQQRGHEWRKVIR